MNWLDKHIDLVESVLDSWLNGSSSGLEEAIQKTVDEDLFPLHDIEFQLSVFRKNLSDGDIREWVKRSGLSEEKNAKGKKILCLHAGNLPLVGFQDAVATILSGADYFGKISRKDPCLLESFLDFAKYKGLENMRGWSTEIRVFKGLKSHKVLFAGSESSVVDVTEKVESLAAIGEDGSYLMRTAKFSIAYLDSKEPEDIRNLVEAMLRYEGRGCRSVVMVVSPYPLAELKEALKEQADFFWESNPAKHSDIPSLSYQKAYNHAIGREQLDMGSFLIHEAEEFPELSGCVNWVEGDSGKVKELQTKFGAAIQSIYSSTSREGFEGITSAQKPSLFWEPDGVDIISDITK